MLRFFVWLWNGLLRLLGLTTDPSNSKSKQESEHLKAEFSGVALEVLEKAQASFLELADAKFQTLRQSGVAELDQKKGLIDQQLSAMKVELEKVSNLVTQLERDRASKFGSLETQLKAMGQQTAALTSTTGALREASANTKARGQWGERLAEDILRAAGFVEGINYKKQATVQTTGTCPDFTFILPKDLTLHMDVKFPFDNYMSFLSSEAEADQQMFKANFLRDVRARIRELRGRDYINPDQQTVDCVLFFIPNESVFSFIGEAAPDIFAEAMDEKVVCCSPSTLFVVLAVVRQAIDNFALQETSAEIMSLMGQFRQQWDKFGEGLTTLGRRLDSTQKAFDDISGTRRRALERPLNKIDQLRLQIGIALPEGFEEDTKGLLLGSEDGESREITDGVTGDPPQLRQQVI